MSSSDGELLLFDEHPWIILHTEARDMLEPMVYKAFADTMMFGTAFVEVVGCGHNG